MISVEEVTRTLERISAMGVHQLTELSNTMQVEQPFVMDVFIAAQG